MYTSIRAELQKARRRHDLIVCLLVPVMALLWCQSAAPTGADELASAYSALFYSLPIINTILMPLAMAILASRLWDVEVKGCTPKLLYTLQSRRSLFAAKAALGLAEIFLIVTLEAAGAPLIGHLQHYTQPYPAAGQAAYLWGCTFAVDCMIFFSELLLTVLLASRGYWYVWPYCLMQRGMNANQSSDMLADSYLGFALACVGWLALILLAVQLLLSHQDVKVR